MNLRNFSCKFFSSTKTLSDYLNDIRKYKQPTPEEEEEIIRRIENGDNSARDELIIRNQRFVYAIAKRYSKDESEVLDFVNEGNIGMMIAIDKYDQTKGFRFLTHAVWYIRREMDNYLYTFTDIVRKPYKQKLGNKVERIKNRFFAENGVYPDEMDVMDELKEKHHLNISSQDILFDISVSSISDQLDDDNYTVEDDKEYNEKTCSAQTYEDTIENDYKNTYIMEMMDVNNIPEINRKMIYLLYGIGYERAYSYEEVGKMMDLSVEDVRQISRNTIQYIRQNKETMSIAV